VVVVVVRAATRGGGGGGGGVFLLLSFFTPGITITRPLRYLVPASFSVTPCPPTELCSVSVFLYAVAPGPF